MKRGAGILIAVLIFALMVISIIDFASATISLGKSSYSIDKKYGLSQGITGWINISVKNENSNSLLKDSLNNAVTLTDLLKLNPKTNYSCEPSNCGEDYAAENSSTAKEFNLNPGESKIIGFRIDGNNFNAVDSFSMRISSTAKESETSQLMIDILNDGTINWGAYKSSNSFDSKNYGCYTGTSSGNAIISTSEYCNKIKMPATPNITLGAKVSSAVGGNVNFIISVTDENENYNSCTATATATGEISCNLDSYAVNEEKNLTVCISLASSGDNDDAKYKINYLNNNSCRGSEDPNFEVFASQSDYSSVGNFVLNNDEISNYGGLSGEYVEDYIANWISERYDNNCSKGCIIPINFTARTEQTIKLDELSVNYNTQIGSTPIIASTDQIYELTKTPAKISFDYGKLYLDGSGLKVKNTTGDFTYTLKLNSEKIFSESLSVQKGPEIISLSPKNTSYGFPTIFKLNLASVKNISKYEWDFGDNSTATTTINKTSHSYNASGTYSVKVIVRDINNISSSKTFQINVNSPALLINKTIELMKKNMAKIENQISSYDSFYRTSLNEQISTSNLSSELRSLENRYTSANESDYAAIITELNEMEVPESISPSQLTSNFVFYPIEDNVNVDVIKSIDVGNYTGSDDSYVKAIYAWNAENMQNNLAFEEISAEYATASKPLLRVFTFKISPKNALNYNSYFIIKDMENLEFKQNYGAKSSDGYKYITLTGGISEITFSTTEDVNFENVPAFISPGLSELSLVSSEDIGEETNPVFPVTTFLMILGIVIVAGVLAYLGLHAWYKRRYEEHLFKNRNDLYNLLHFIDSQRKKGIDESEINQKLKKSGWSSEQIRYATRKHSGKRTGMPGI